MAKVAQEEPRIAEADGFEAQAKEYIFTKKQSDFFEKKMKELKEKLFSFIDEDGETDASGNLFIQFPSPIEGVVALQKQRRVSRKIDELVAERIIEEKGMEDTLYKMVRVVDEDALMAALYADELTEAEIDEMFPEKVIYALILNKK